MYTTLLEHYIFNPNTKTIVSLDITQVRKDCVQYIVNKTINVLIWDRMHTAFSDITCSGNTITFDADNTGMSASDVLEIGYIFQKPESLGIGLPIDSGAIAQFEQQRESDILDYIHDLLNFSINGEVDII